MRLTLLKLDAAREVLHEAIGRDPTDVAGIADLIRCEISARSMCQRSSAIRRVQRLVAPVASIDENKVAEVCDLLEREGDVVVASGGLLFGTPLRTVDLGNGEVRVASSLPTKHLSTRMAGTWSVNGVSRACRFDDIEQARSAVVAANGVMVSPAGWACLERVSRADQAWLDLLDRRLRARPERAGSLESDEPLPWRGCVASDGGFRWAPPDSAKEARLWRARNRWGHWLFAWTSEGTPKVSPFVTLRRDEGTRSAFAVAQALSSPVEVSIDWIGQVAELVVSNWLPIAEYRFLAVSSSSYRFEGRDARWVLPKDRLKNVLDILHERLGLVVQENGPHLKERKESDAGGEIFLDETNLKNLSLRSRKIIKKYNLDTPEKLQKWLASEASHNIKNFGRTTRKELEKVLKELGDTGSFAKGNLKQNGQFSTFIDVVEKFGDLPIEKFGRLPIRTRKVLKRNNIFTISHLIDWLHRVDVHNERNYGRKTHDDLVATIERLGRVGPVQLAFGRPLIPQNVSDLCSTYIEHLPEAAHKEIFRCYFFKRMTLEEIGQSRKEPVTRERIRQVIESNVIADRDCWEDVAIAILLPVMQLMATGAGLAPLDTCLEKAGANTVGQIELASKLAGISITIPRDGRLNIISLLSNEEIGQLRTELRQAVEEAISIDGKYEQVESVFREWGIHLEEIEIRKIANSFLGLEFRDTSAYSSRHKTRQKYIQCLRNAGRAVTAQEVADLVAREDEDLAPTARLAVTHFRRTEEVLSVGRGKWIHLANAGVTREVLRKAAEACLSLVPKTGVAVNVKTLIKKMNLDEPGSKNISPYMLRDAMISTGKVRGWRSGCEVAWLGADISRSSVLEWIEVVAQSIDQPFQLSELVPLVASHGGFTEQTVTMTLGQSSDLLLLGGGEYISIDAVFPNREQYLSLCERVTSAIPESDVIATRGLASKCPLGETLVSSAIDPLILWGIGRIQKGILSRIRGHMVWRKSHADTLWFALRKGTTYCLSSAFKVKQLSDWLTAQYGVTDESLTYALIQEGQTEGYLLGCGQGWYLDLLVPGEDLERCIDTTKELERLVRCSQDFVRLSPAKGYLNASRKRRGLFEVL